MGLEVLHRKAIKWEWYDGPCESFLSTCMLWIVHIDVLCLRVLITRAVCVSV